MKRLLFVTAAASMLVFTGCSNPCLRLAETICDCETTAVARDTCNRNARNQSTLVDVTGAQEDACEAALEVCTRCELLQTEQGKRDCALAR
jgi:hypothetical protein